ncbi:unnamed protein product [Withania somnifera]
MAILSSSSPIFLPREIIFDALSYLPVKSLLRFNCVCKHWNDITQDFLFICLHYRRAPSITWETQTQSNATTGEDEFIPFCSKGLVLEYATRPSHFPHSPNLRYRIRNPEMQHQILEIPNSQSLILNMCIVFDPEYQVLKLLSVVYTFEKTLGYEVLHLWNEESTYSWRPLNCPQQSRGETRICNPVKRHSRQIRILHEMGISYSIWNTAVNSHLGIDILDMVNDSYIGHTTFPTGYYTKDDCIIWNGKLSFSKIVKEELHVLVLDDYKKQIKWADRKLIIKLPFMRTFSVVQEQLKILLFHESKLWFWLQFRDKKLLSVYDITTGKVKPTAYDNNRDFFNSTRRPCLVAFKGINATIV